MSLIVFVCVASAAAAYLGLRVGYAAARRGKSGIAIFVGDVLIIASTVAAFTPLRHIAVFGVPAAPCAGLAAVFFGAGLVGGAYAVVGDSFLKRWVISAWHRMLNVEKSYRMAGGVRGPDAAGAWHLKYVYAARIRFFAGLRWSGGHAGWDTREECAISQGLFDKVQNEVMSLTPTVAWHYLDHAAMALKVLAQRPLLTIEERQEIELLIELAGIFNRRFAKTLSQEEVEKLETEISAWYQNYPWK